MAAIPPGFAPVQPQRRVQFDFAPGTPPEVIAATQAYAAADEQGAEIPQGFSPVQPLPGLGSNAGESEQQRNLAQVEALKRLEGPGMVPSFVSGNAYGVAETGAGLGQLSARFLDALNPGAADGRGLVLGAPPYLAPFADQAAADLDARRQSDPAMQTVSGRFGRFTGGMVATSPLAAASVPAKGASIASWLTQGGIGGGLSALTQPVEGGEDYWRNKFNQGGLGTLVGAGVPGAARFGMSALERLGFAPNSMAQVANFANSRANAKPFAQEGEDLATRTGVRMTPGQVSGSKVQTALENMSRQSIFSADTAFEADKRIAEDAIRNINRVMDNVTRSPASEAAIGTQIQTVTRGAVVRIAEAREAQALKDYGAIDFALKGRKFVQPDNAMAEADAIIREYSAVASPEAARIVKQAEALKEQLRNNGGLTFTQAQRSRSYYGRGAKGAANVFDEVNPDINRRIATRIFKAFDADIEQSASRLEQGNLGPGLVAEGFFNGKLGQQGNSLVDAIRRANGNYRRYSQLIEATENHPIARLFGDHIKIDDVVEFDKIPPETVIQRLGGMRPSELRMVRDFMERNGPEAWQQYKRLLIEKALDTAQTFPGSAGANTVPFNANAFLRALGGDKPDRIKQLQAVFSSSELSEIDDAFRIARRLGDNFGKNHSGTGPYQEAMSFFDRVRSRSFQALASTGGEVLGLRKVANVMLRAEGRRALIELSRLPPGSRQAASLLGVISALAASQPPTRGHNPQRRY